MSNILDTASGFPARDGNVKAQPITIQIGNVGPHLSGQTVALTERLYLTADKNKVVREGSEHARFLLGGPGDEIPVEQAIALGMVVQDDDDEVEDETKQRTPAKNKQRKPAENKEQ